METHERKRPFATGPRAIAERTASAYSRKVSTRSESTDEATDTATVGPQQAADPLVLSIDVGTSSARAIVYDARGRAVRGYETHRPYAVHTTPDGGVTIDADEVVDLVAQCLDTVLEGVRSADRQIASISADTFWHSMLGTGDEGKCLTPVYTWADTRSAAQAQELKRRLDAKAVHAQTGAALHSSYWPAKLLWLQQTDGDLFSSVRYWMSFAEYLYLQFFGERRASISMVSGTGLFDPNRCDWVDTLLDTLRVSREQLSPVTDFTESMKGPSGRYEGRWQELRDCPWYLPIGDGAASNVGSGGFSEDQVVVMVGTSGAMRVVREAERVDVPPGLWTYRVDRRRFVQGGALSDGGNVWAWLQALLRLPGVGDLERDLAGMAPDAHGLTVLPFLAGERSPHWNPDARAAYVGMRLDTSPKDMVRASLEAIAYRFGAIYRILRRTVPEPRSIIGSGAGLIHSPAWLQIMADELGESIQVSAVPEATSRGAALLALEEMGALRDLASAPAALGDTYRPDESRVSVYRSAMERQDALYRRLLGDG
jgi:gluconokinase